eukprot:gb/GFBE01075652.1/.p1 GENE.gb/GFBE01075652.1/~~gb/GFBE01075652.1/.p1  ORF type:complete len:143 (+),score=17.58 gb/GFBE01075652.1/:1-429(+)
MFPSLEIHNVPPSQQQSMPRYGMLSALLRRLSNNRIAHGAPPPSSTVGHEAKPWPLSTKPREAGALQVGHGGHKDHGPIDERKSGPLLEYVTEDNPREQLADCLGKLHDCPEALSDDDDVKQYDRLSKYHLSSRSRKTAYNK